MEITRNSNSNRYLTRSTDNGGYKGMTKIL